jgi:hypothetical protein
VISALVETLIPEVLDYVKLAEAEFRVELVAKVFTAVQRFAPNATRNFDAVHRILIENGNYVENDILTSLCRPIARTRELQRRAVSRLGSTMMNFTEAQSLMQVTSWGSCKPGPTAASTT